jgi:adenylate cyclase
VSVARPLGWLVPRPDESGAALVRRTAVSLVISLSVANLIGAAATYAIGQFVLGFPDVDDPSEARLANLIAFGVYMLISVPLGAWWALRRARSARDWLREDRVPTAEERRLALRAPGSIVFVHVVIWSLAALVFGLLNATYSVELGRRVALTVLFGGLTTCAVVYLVSERLLRGGAARALTGAGEDRRLAPGIKTRTFLAWVLGTAVPMLGLGLVALSALTEEDFTRDELAIAVLSLGGVALLAGLLVSMLSARAVADPVVSVRKAMERVEGGDLDVEVPVYDGSEVGQLQAGFNRMVDGLRERERIQDLFGRQVGEDVARAALEQEVELGGETREVSVLFVDIVGSTRLASERPASDVVDMLNRFFGVVVEVVRKHDGWVNKFEGDAALAVFGAPVPLSDHAGQALAAARELHERLREVDEVEAGIGVSSGEVVAGNVGSEHRFEYTVIGDPVNEAARLTELAKERGGVLASSAALDAAEDGEAANWRLDGSVALRGRGAETRLAVPT